MNTENPVHAFGKRTRTQHLANAQVKVLYLFPYLPSKQNLCFFVFFGVGNQGPRGQGQTWGVNCGEFAWGSFWGAQTLGALRGGEIVSGLPLFEKNGIESHYLPPPTHYLPPPCHVQIYSFFSRLHLKHKMHVAWKG